MEAIAHASLDDLQLAEEVGPKVAEAVVQYFSEPGNRELVSRLRKAGLQFTYASTRPKAGPLQGKTLVITGTLPTLSRDEAKQLIEQAGGKVGSAVSKKTSYVVVGEDAGSKLAKARELGIPTLTEDELRAPGHRRLSRISGTSHTRTPRVAPRWHAPCSRPSAPRSPAPAAAPIRAWRAALPSASRPAGCASGHRLPGPSTYHGRRMVAFNPALRIASSASVRAAIYSRMTGAGCATLTYTRCRTPPAAAAEIACSCRCQVDAAELLLLRRAGMRHAHQVNQGIAARHELLVRRRVQRIAGDAFAPRRQPRFRSAPHQPAHAVPARHQFRREAPAHEPARPRDEDARHPEEEYEDARRLDDAGSGSGAT